MLDEDGSTIVLVRRRVFQCGVLLHICSLCTQSRPALSFFLFSSSSSSREEVNQTQRACSCKHTIASSYFPLPDPAHLLVAFRDVFLVASPEGAALVRKAGSRLRCSVCTVSGCTHTVAVKEHAVTTDTTGSDVEDAGSDEEEAVEDQPVEWRCYSWRGLTPTHLSHPDLAERHEAERRDSRSLYGDTAVDPDLPEECPHCGMGEWAEPCGGSVCTFLTLSFPVGLLVQHHSCRCCGRHIPFDGLALGLLNFNNALGISHALFGKFLLRIRDFGTPFSQLFSQFITDLPHNHLSHTPFFPLSYQTFRRLMWAGLQLLDLPVEALHRCPHCGPDPAVLVGDGVSHAFQRKHLQLDPTPTTSTTSTTKGYRGVEHC
eukprot:GCRY01003535.1.p1 GENE.GCRY01003535.1~~GCRY01003535.1.p1  ORF type:complete len:374 (+),score=110.92 GCRY01003535.1:1704-2825(+)